jgi:hypothetical protein
MDFLNKNFNVICDKYNYVQSFAEPNKLIYKVEYEPDYFVFYDGDYKILKIESENLCWENEKLDKNDDFGILQKFKNYDPRFIVNNFQKISDSEFRQNLNTPFPGFTSHQIFIFDKLSYIKKSFLNGRELTEQELKFNISFQE